MKSISEINEELQKFLNEEDLQCVDTISLLEMATIVTLSDNHVIKNIGVNPDRKRNWRGVEYFKIYNASSVRKATKLARIRFRTAEYEIHEGSNWNLNNKAKKDLIDILRSPCNKIPGIKTVWEYAIFQFNMEAHEDSVYGDCLKTQKELNKIKGPKRDYLPIDLPMPNYEEL